MSWPIPLHDPLDPGRPPVALDRRARAAVTARRLAARTGRAGRRRLAVVDTHLPWRLSGFRYDEARELVRRRPDTVCFSLFELTDPFPAHVHLLADFPRLAPALGVTDVHVVFLNLAVSVLGLGAAARPPVAGVREDLDLSGVLRRHGMRLHATVYPGGGLTPDSDPRVLRELAARARTVFITERWLRRHIPSAVDTEVPVDTTVYPLVARDSSARLRLVFAGDDRPRKGLVTLLDAFERLGDGFSLDIVGPHERHCSRLDSRVTSHGWLDPHDLRAVYDRCDVFVSPATADTAQDGYGDLGVVDGFPTTAARAAMLTGACLVASNPAADHALVSPGEHYVEFPERDGAALARTLQELRRDPARVRAVAARGAARMRERVAVTAVVGAKLRGMGL